MYISIKSISFINKHTARTHKRTPLQTHMKQMYPTTSLQNKKTERAADRVKEILNGDSASGALGIRLGVKRRKLSSKKKT